MGVLAVTKANTPTNNVGQHHCPIGIKDLDNSQGTALTDSSDSSDTEPAPTPRAPIMISEDDADVDIHDHHVKETYFHASLIKDSIRVQRHHKVNDDEPHEENPHLEDFLIPHHSVHIERPEEVDEAVKSIALGDSVDPQDKKCRNKSILHHTEVKVSEPEIKKAPKRRVHFGTVLVRDYEMVLGDHPCCSYGPPVTIDWDYLEYEALEVDEYEFHHPPRRSIIRMGLNYYRRLEILSGAGFTEVEMKKSTKQVNRTKFKRSLTRQISSNYILLKAEAALESAVRKVKRLQKADHWKHEKSQFAKSKA
mmetsp:Transcript_36628/g.62373  ORF Transcript_36628/g.62373 Transcript_36628/m.62373 type:complete len:308 (+) Transcript_36628:88-1011(+)